MRDAVIVSAVRTACGKAAKVTVNRFCASGPQSIALAVDRICGGGAWERREFSKT